jgi:23S rRNA G2445 N2-methylase RlmL
VNDARRASAGPPLREPPPRPIRLAPDQYVAHTQPGFQTVAWSEIAARVPGARNIAMRTVVDRAGMVVFAASRPEPLGRLRTVEDLFALVGYRQCHGKEMLETVRATARGAPFVDAGLAARTRLAPGRRSGRRLGFRVVARLSGEHAFRRVDFQRAVERGITERGDHDFRLADDSAEVEFWATMLGGEFLLALRLSDERMRQREYKIAHRPASLRPSVAAALVVLSEPRDDDIVLDPFCGAGTVLIERAHFGRYRNLIGSDRDVGAIDAARANIGARYQPIELHSWDAAALPLGDATVTRIVTNLPWGVRSGTPGQNRRLYGQWLAEMNRVLKRGGKLVVLTAETRLMHELRVRGVIAPERIMRVTVLGRSASVFVCTAK